MRFHEETGRTQIRALFHTDEIEKSTGRPALRAMQTVNQGT